MDSGKVEKMTTEEIAECPVGIQISIKTVFKVFLM